MSGRQDSNLRPSAPKAPHIYFLNNSFYFYLVYNQLYSRFAIIKLMQKEVIKSGKCFPYVSPKI